MLNVGPGIFSELFPFSFLFFFLRKEIILKSFQKHKMTIALLSLLTSIVNFERKKENVFFSWKCKNGR